MCTDVRSDFGWDWGPVLPLSGITKDIELQFVNNAKIDYLGITQRLEDGKAFVSVKADVTSFGNYECEIGITSPSGEVMTACGECAARPQKRQSFAMYSAFRHCINVFIVRGGLERRMLCSSDRSCMAGGVAEDGE